MLERNIAYSRQKSYFSFIIQKNMILLLPIAFLLGRAAMLEGLTPFGIAFFVALYKENKKYLILGLVILAGTLSTQGIYKAMPYVAFVLATIFTFNYKDRFQGKKTYYIAITSIAIYLPIKLFFLVIDSFNVYGLIMILFELLVIFTVIYIASYAIPVIAQKCRRQILNTEEIICVAIVGGLALLGIGNWAMYEVSVSNVIGIIIIIVFAYSAGTGAGAAIGITLGLITSMAGGRVTPSIIGTFALSGLLAGLFKDLGKIGCALGFLLGAGILAFYTNGYYGAIIRWQEILVAFLLFLIIPQAWLLQLKKLGNFSIGTTYESNKYREEINQKVATRLIDFSETFNELSKSFENIVNKQGNAKHEDMPKVIEKIAESTCANCGLKRICWEENYVATYQALSKIMTLIETEDENGIMNDYNKVLKKCIRVEQITEAMMLSCELSKTMDRLYLIRQVPRRPWVRFFTPWSPATYSNIKGCKVRESLSKSSSHIGSLFSSRTSP